LKKETEDQDYIALLMKEASITEEIINEILNNEKKHGV